MFFTHVVNEQDSWDSEDEVDNTNDTSGEKRHGTSTETDLGEDCGGVVDDGCESHQLRSLLHTVDHTHH